MPKLGNSFLRVEFVNPFIVSLKNVLSTMAQVELKSQKPEKKTNDFSRGDVTGIIGMIGPQVRGSLSITFCRKLASNVMKNMLGEQIEEIDEQVMDMVGEMTNMICGGAKNALAEQSYQFEMATPVIVSGNGHVIQHKVDGPKIILAFTSDKGNAFMEICFTN